MLDSSTRESLLMARTGDRISSDKDTLRSLSLVIDRRTEPKPNEVLLCTEVFGVPGDGEAFLLGPKGRRERRARKEGIPEPAGVVGCWGDAATAGEGVPPFAAGLVPIEGRLPALGIPKTLRLGCAGGIDVDVEGVWGE
jgi:hypothetical protein